LFLWIENTAEGHGSDGFHGLMLWTARGLNREHGLLICRFAWPRLGFCLGLYMAEAMVIIAVRAWWWVIEDMISLRLCEMAGRWWWAVGEHGNGYLGLRQPRVWWCDGGGVVGCCLSLNRQRRGSKYLHGRRRRNAARIGFQKGAAGRAGLIRSRSSLQWTDRKRDVMEDVELLQNWIASGRGQLEDEDELNWSCWIDEAWWLMAKARSQGRLRLMGGKRRSFWRSY
jgi:hypothetical protein